MLIPMSVPMIAAPIRAARIRRRVGSLRDRGMPAILPTAVPHRTPPKGTGDRSFVPVGRARTRCYAAPAVRIPVLLYALAFVVRIVLAAMYTDPAYPDSYYYVDVARHRWPRPGASSSTSSGSSPRSAGIPDPAVLPIASNAHWLPLASFLQVPFIWLLGPTACASTLPLVIIGSIAAPLTWVIARDAGARADVALGAGVHRGDPGRGRRLPAPNRRTSRSCAPLIAATMWLTARGLKGDPWSYVAAGLLVGLASLARNDGIPRRAGGRTRLRLGSSCMRSRRT